MGETEAVDQAEEEKAVLMAQEEARLVAEAARLASRPPPSSRAAQS